MFSFITAFDNYTDEITKIKKYEYDTIEGNLRFVKYKNNIIVIDVIYVKECFRRKGILKKLLFHVVNFIDNNKHKKFIITSVISKILYNYLINFEHNGYMFKLTRDGFILRKTKL